MRHYFQSRSNGNETVLYRFTGGTDGGNPFAALVRDAAGNLYGTTLSGGASNQGVVFRLTTGGKETVLHSFNGTDGAFPNDLLLDPAGYLYGTSQSGGAYNEGVVFKLTP